MPIAQHDAALAWSIVALATAGVALFHEHLTPWRAAGATLIVVGAILLCRTPSGA